MYHYRPVFLPVFTDVVYVEPFRQVKVDLNRRSLPETAERIFELGIDLGAVEYAFSWIHGLSLIHIFTHR